MSTALFRWLRRDVPTTGGAGAGPGPSQLISLGIGSPASIAMFLSFGLSMGVSLPDPPDPPGPPPPLPTVYSLSALVEVFLNADWVNVTDDVLVMPLLSIRRGSWNTGPDSAGMAQTGHCRFVLDNSDHNSAATVGYYSPGHLNCRDGFTRGVRVRVTLSYGTSSRVNFVGKLTQIAVVSGVDRQQDTLCVGTDWIDELARHEVLEVSPQANARVDDLANVVLDSMPANAQPTWRSFDVGVDTFPYAFDDLGTGGNGLQLLSDVMASERARFAVLGDGSARLWNRQAILTQPVQKVFTDAELLDLVSPGDLDRTFNRVRITIHPKLVNDATVEVLTSLTGPAPEFAASETKTFWLNYRDPNNDTLSIGGKDFEDPLVATTDYTANAASDGSGADRTADFDVVVDFFASVMKVEVTNNHASLAYLTSLQGRGIAIRDLSPATYEATTPKPYGLRTLRLDMPYQDDGNVAQDLADVLLAQYSSEDRADVDLLQFDPHDSDAHMDAAIERDVGDRVQVTEEMTGLLLSDVIITGVEITVGPALQMTCRWAVATIFVYDAFVLDDPIRGILDGTDYVLGAA